MIKLVRYTKKETLILTNDDEFVIKDIYNEYNFKRYFSLYRFREAVIDFSINEIRDIDNSALYLAEKIKENYGN